jgi:PAS domain S-box-containing protein
MHHDRPDVKPTDSTNGVLGEAELIHVFSELIRSREDWLMDRILFYAKRQGYARYTSTLKEAWRLSIAGLSASILETLERLTDQELSPEEDFTRDPAAAFGLLEAARHRQRGISLPMFLGLMKYYRQSYQDMTEASGLPADGTARARVWVDRFFDRVEIAFCSAWATSVDEGRWVELQEANRTITNEKNKYLTVFESSATAAVLLDDALRIVNLNRAAAQLFGLDTTPGSHYYKGTRGGQIGRTKESQPAAPAFFLEQLSGELSAFTRSAETAREFEKSMDTAVGRRCFNMRLSRMLDVSDKFSGTVVLLEDWTEKKRIGDELARQERFLESVLDAIQDGITVLDTDLTIVRVNAAMNRIRAVGAPLEGKKCYEAYYGRLQPCDKCPALRAVKSGKLESEEIVLRRGDKITAFLEVFAFPMRDDQGRIMGVVDYARNVTERKALEEERLQREKLETVLEIAGAVCHELNQPLMALSGYHELIRFNLDEQSPANKNLGKAHKQIQRMTDITSRLMSITRYETCGYAGGVKILDLEKSAGKPGST